MRGNWEELHREREKQRVREREGELNGKIENCLKIFFDGLY